MDHVSDLDNGWTRRCGKIGHMNSLANVSKMNSVIEGINKIDTLIKEAGKARQRLRI